MKEPAIPRDETARLEALRRYEVLDTLPEQDYDDLTQLAAHICETPIALVSLIDADRQWFKSRTGLDAEETPRDISFCGHVVADRQALVVPDATRDERFADNPLVAGAPDIRFYAGIPLITPSDHYIGTLCVIDMEPRELDDTQLAALERLSRQVINQLELRLNLKQLGQAREEVNLALEAAQRASLAKSQFLANMSHELRTPLNAIIGYSEMLAEEAEDEGRLKTVGDLTRIRNSGKHLLRLINDILDVSKIEAGRFDLDLQDFDAALLVREVAKVIEPAMQRNGNRLAVRIADGTASMHSDPQRLTQCLLNLLSNAAKFTENGEVELSVGPADNCIDFSVTDAGIGLSDESQARLFQRFEQIESGTRRQEGTGLGLSLSQDLARMMGGEISVESEEGRGSTFVLRLPRHCIPPAGPSTAAKAERAPQAARDG